MKYTFLSPTSYIDCIIIWNSIISSYLNESDNNPITPQHHEFFTNLFLSFLNKILLTKDNFLLQFDNSGNYNGNIISLIEIESKIETIINDIKNEHISDIKIIKYDDTITEREYVRNITCELLSLLCQLTNPIISIVFEYFTNYITNINFADKNNIYEDMIVLVNVFVIIIIIYIYMIRYVD